MSITGPTDPRALVAYGIASGLVTPAPVAPAETLHAMLKRKVADQTRPKQASGRQTKEAMDLRRKQIHALAAAGRNRKEIAARLKLSAPTVRRYLRDSQ